MAKNTEFNSSQKATQATDAKGRKKAFQEWMHKILISNNALKILAILSSLALWMYVSTYIDPTTTETIHGIVVTGVNADSSMLQIFDLIPINYTAKTVSVRVTGNRLDIANLTADDFTATAGLSTVTSSGVHELPITVTLNERNDNIEIEKNSTNPSIISVEFDVRVEKEFNLLVDTDSIVLPSEDYLLSDYATSPISVVVTGPQKEVEKIETAQVSVELPESLSDYYRADGDIVLLDSNGDVIQSDLLTLNERIATVTIPIELTKTVPLTVTMLNIPDNIDRSALENCLVFSTDSIQIAGSQSLVNEIDSIPLGYIDIRELSPGTIFPFTPSTPARIRALGAPANVTVQLNPEMDWGEVTLNTRNIEIIYAPVQYEVTCNYSTISNITLVGNPAILATLSGDDIVAEINLFDRDLTEGQFEVPVSIILPGRNLVWAVGENTAIITVTEK